MSPRGRRSATRGALGRPVRAAMLAGAAVLLGALAPSRAACRTICDDCMSTNDTTSTPGRTALPEYLAGMAIAPPIAFVDRDRVLRCALPVNSGWEIGIVDSAAGAGGCSMALDDLNLPTIAYHDGNGRLLRARRLATGWSRETVDSMSVVLGGTSITRETSGLAITYADASTGLLMFAEQDAGGTWHSEVVAAAGAAEAYPSLVFDDPVRAISYYDASNGRLRLAIRQAAGVWNTETIDANGDVGGYTSLVGGPSHGGFGVAYYDFTNADLRYARSLVGGGWSIDTVDGVGVAAGRSCSAVAFGGGPDEEVGIAYYDRTNGNLKYAIHEAGAWSITVLDAGGDAGGSASAGGTPVPGDTLGVAYVESDSGNVKYLWRPNDVTAVSPPARQVSAPLNVTWLRSDGAAGGTIRFTVPSPGPTRVTVYDAVGRRIATPLRQDLPPGAAEARWDGSDERGHTVPSGVYLVHVEAAGRTGSAHAVLMH